MSTAFAIAAVTEVLRALLEKHLDDSEVDTVLGVEPEVTTVPPDTITLTGPDAHTALNVFLHRVSTNPGWRNTGLPSTDADGRRTGRPPLALDLHYLLTAYGPQALQPEVLLGHGMQLLHERPVLDRGEVDGILAARFPTVGLSQQVEQLKITPEDMSVDDQSKLWSVLGAKYRPTAAYAVSVVLIQRPAFGQASLPVLTRRVDVTPSMLPSVPGITALLIPGGHPGATAGQTIGAEGQHLLDADVSVRLVNRRYDVDETVPSVSGGGPSLVRFQVPVGVPVGTYATTVLIRPAANAPPRRTNRLPLTIVPSFTTAFPVTATPDPDGSVTLTLGVSPQVLPDQEVSVILGSAAYPAAPHPAPTSTVTFTVPDAPLGDHLTRLRVDGLDSLVVDRSTTPPTYLDRRVQIQ